MAVQLVGKHIDSSVNNPIEAIAQWRGGKLVRSASSTASNSPTRTRLPTGSPGATLPTCKSAGLDVEYLMLRGIFTTPGATKDQVDFYVDLLKKVRETPEWASLMKDGAFNQTFMEGADYAKWVEGEQQRHQSLMKDAGFLAGK